jgi:hypothetical protein
MKINYNSTYKIDKYLEMYFPVIYQYKFDGIPYLLGGAVKDILLDNTPKDIDITVYSILHNNTKKFVDTFSLDYNMNNFNGFKINYNNTSIDMWDTNDLLKVVQYNLDGLLYDINQHVLLSFGFIKGLEDNEIFKVNGFTHPNKNREFERLNKLKTYMTINL